jgi:predicted HTH transcriptional regulator
MVHNDYSREIPPKFEIFSDRLEITSAGSLSEGMTEEEFFEGYSIPRNKEIMRIYKDLEMVEHLGSGIPRILQSYSKENFKFTANFLRMSFKSVEPVYNDDSKNGLVDGLVESQKMIIELIIKNPKISKKEMSGQIGISTTAIDKNIDTLKKKNIIERIGSDNKGYWNVIEK